MAATRIGGSGIGRSGLREVQLQLEEAVDVPESQRGDQPPGGDIALIKGPLYHLRAQFRAAALHLPAQFSRQPLPPVLGVHQALQYGPPDARLQGQVHAAHDLPIQFRNEQVPLGRVAGAAEDLAQGRHRGAAPGAVSPLSVNVEPDITHEIAGAVVPDQRGWFLHIVGGRSEAGQL